MRPPRQSLQTQTINTMNNEFQKLLELAYSDGVLTEAENALLLKKAKQLGMDEIEAELIIANYQPASSAIKSDNYDISNEELLQRLSSFSQHINSASAQIQLYPFPMLVEGSNKISSSLSTGRKALAAVLKGDIINETLSVAGKTTKVPGGKLAGKLVGKGISGLAKKVAGVELKKLSQQEIIELVESYLVILELRKVSNETLSKKFDYFTQLVQNAKQNPIKKKGLFG